jgi:hypothetical protein
MGCAKGTPENSRALSPKNVLAYHHYLKCSATGRWPDDHIVLQNAGIIREAEVAAERFLAWKRDKQQRDLRMDIIRLVSARIS